MKIPTKYLFSIVLVFVGLFIRLRITESPVFAIAGAGLIGFVCILLVRPVTQPQGSAAKAAQVDTRVPST